MTPEVESKISFPKKIKNKNQLTVLIVGNNHVGDIINNENAVGAAVVAGYDCAKSLLTCTVPLQSKNQREDWPFNVQHQQSEA
jgi:hypothetical protein